MTSDADGDARQPAEPARPWDDPASEDVALARLEDVLLAAPYDRALPDLGELLDRAGVTPEYLRRDERALKVLSEAILARPLSSRDEVARVRTSVELMTLEVEVLSARLADPDADADALRRARTRLARIRAELRELRDQL